MSRKREIIESSAEDEFLSSPSKQARTLSFLSAMLDGIDCIVLDIEGTITPITFVHDVLFPYARAHVRQYLGDTFECSQTQSDLKLLFEQSAKDRSDASSAAFADAPEVVIDLASHSQDEIIASAVCYVEYCMDRDRKVGALKTLQGHIWTRGYETAAFLGAVFPDVAAALQRWKSAGKTIYIYSSGSVEAQQLLVRYSSSGDLRNFFSDYFDTKIGDKKDAGSYVRISKEVHCSPSEILFISDNVDELRAATAAGFQVALAVRPGNPALPENCEFKQRAVTSFSFL
jgi:enolase-phosphatase E1